MPGTGNGFELDAIAGVVIGGTSLAGGVGSIAGTLIGVFILSLIHISLNTIVIQIINWGSVNDGMKITAEIFGRHPGNSG